MNKQSGFTLIELLVVIVLVGLVGTMFYNFFSINLGSYLKLQADASEAGNIAAKSQQVASVVRSATGISNASANELTLYSYFYPSDTYVSLVRYYLSSDQKTLYCDVTPMSSNPPIGTPQTAKLKRYTIATTFSLPADTPLFSYQDASRAAIATPVVDLNSIKIVQVNLAIKNASGAQQDLGLQVQLRNRKTNL